MDLVLRNKIFVICLFLAGCYSPATPQTKIVEKTVESKECSLKLSCDDILAEKTREARKAQQDREEDMKQLSKELSYWRERVGECEARAAKKEIKEKKKR